MVLLRHTFGALLVGACHGLDWHHMYEALRAPATTAAQQYPEHWYDGQTLDHFSPEDTRTFRQRYFLRTEHFRPGGPIIMRLGQEDAWDASAVVNLFINEELASALGAVFVVVEHRFYGKSQPFNNTATKNLKYLTSRQSLHDYAQFTQWFKASHPAYEQSNVFCVGGSYSGAQAAWYRLEFPHVTSGCWSLSGPVEARYNWFGMGQKVWRAIGTDQQGRFDETIPEKLYAGYAQVASLAKDSTKESFQRLLETFNVCPGTLVSDADRANFETSVCTALAKVAQYNNTQAPANHLKAVQEVIRSAKTGFEAAIKISHMWNVTMPTDGESCVDYSIGAVYRDFMNDTLTNGMSNGDRMWRWQNCNEFGFWQSATRDFDLPTLYTEGPSHRSQFPRVCRDVFGVDEQTVEENVAKTNLYYGGKHNPKFSRLLFTNGNLDPWSQLSVTEYPENDREVHVLVAPLDSHSVGLYRPRPGQPAGAEPIHEKVLALWRRWDAMDKAARSGAPVQEQTLFA